jgi:hypothetical protein
LIKALSAKIQIKSPNNQNFKIMKTVIGYGLILLGIVSFFRIEGFGRNFYESIGILIGLALFVVPGILLVRSGMNKTEEQK